MLPFVVFITVLSTLLLMGAQRRRKMALLVAIGLPPRSLAGIVSLEALAAGVIGSVLGSAVSVGLFWGLSLLFPVVIGYVDPFRTDPLSLAIYGAAAVGVVVAASLLPAWCVGRIEVPTTLQYE